MSLRITPLMGVVLALGLLSSGGCQNTASSTATSPAGTTAPATGGKPAWIYQPSPGQGQFGGVGSARRHIDGISAQRQMAISRAIDEIARQMGVKVSNFVRTETHLRGDSVQSGMDLYSIQKKEKKTVNAAIRAFWEDPQNGELYVWMTTV